MLRAHGSRAPASSATTYLGSTRHALRLRLRRRRPAPRVDSITMDDRRQVGGAHVRTSDPPRPTSSRAPRPAASPCAGRRRPSRGPAVRGWSRRRAGSRFKGSSLTSVITRWRRRKAPKRGTVPRQRRKLMRCRCGVNDGEHGDSVGPQGRGGRAGSAQDALWRLSMTQTMGPEQAKRGDAHERDSGKVGRRASEGSS